MTGVIAVLTIALAVVTLAFIALWVVEARKSAGPDPGRPDAERVAVGFVANFFDALGIGSFATTTTYWRLRKLVKDELIPGSLNVGHCLPTITQAVISFKVFKVDPWTLVLMIAAAVVGAWFGAAVVSRMPRRQIQIGMGVALLLAAGFMFAKVTAIMPPGGETLGVRGGLLVVAVVGSFFLGSIMPLGIGYYAPSMILVSMLGMNVTATWPIMTGACAFLMPVASMQFVRKRRYSFRASLGLTVGGVFGSAIALLAITQLNLKIVMWLVTFVVVYTGISLLRTAAREGKTGPPVAAS